MYPSVCPGVEELKQFRGGRLPAADVQRLEQHLRSCLACVDRLAADPVDDPLVLGLRAPRGRPRLRNPLLSAPFWKPAPTPFGPGRNGSRCLPCSRPPPRSAIPACPCHDRGPARAGRPGGHRGSQRAIFLSRPGTDSRRVGLAGDVPRAALAGRGRHGGRPPGRGHPPATARRLEGHETAAGRRPWFAAAIPA